MNFDELNRWLLACEGLRLKPYLDTEKKWTVGIGRNLSDCKLSKDEATFLLNNDPVKTRFYDLPENWYLNTDEIVKYLKERSISVNEAEYLLNNDVARAKEALKNEAFYSMQPESVQCALINMAFQMGVHGLLKFENMIHWLLEKNYTKAASEALNSDWGRTYIKRAKDVALIIREGSP